MADKGFDIDVSIRIFMNIAVNGNCVFGNIGSSHKDAKMLHQLTFV